MELQLPQLDQHIHNVAKNEGFVIDTHSLEVVGVCTLCEPAPNVIQYCSPQKHETLVHELIPLDRANVG